MRVFACHSKETSSYKLVRLLVNVYCKHALIIESTIARNEGHAPALYSGFLHESWIPRAFYPAAFRVVIENKMASGLKRSRNNVDYQQLHSFSSTVLYDTTPKRSRSKFFDVEKIIERRKRRQVS